MPQFSYKARRRTGEVVEGMLEVADRSAALMQIERLGLFPVAVDAAKAGAVLASQRGASRKVEWQALLPPGLRNALTQKRKPKLQEMATFTQQMANLLHSGMPLTVALNSMTHLESKGIPAEVSKELKQDVMEGRSLSDAMSKQPRIFSDLYVNMVRAGESSGALVEVLRRMADHFERFSQVQAKFTSALIYPAFVAVVGICLVFFFMSYMLPKFMSIFVGMNVPLPMLTQILVTISNVFAKYWWAMLLTVLALIILFKRFQASAEGQRKIDRWKMTAPVFGKVIKLNLFGQFARTLSTLLENGVPVLTALKITEQILPNSVVKEAIAKTREEVTDGKTIAQPLARSKIFPQLMVDLVKIGEETGDVPGALKNVADTYENELVLALKVVTNMIEPVMILVMAALVGFLLFGSAFCYVRHDRKYCPMMIVRVSSVGGRVGKGIREPSVKGRAEFSTGRKQVLSSLDTRHSTPFFLRAFTLLELMIVVAIMGVILTIGVPIVYKMGHESALRKAVKDVVEVCSYARALAILQSKATCVVFHPREGSFAVQGAGNLSERPISTSSMATESNAKGSGLSGQLSDRVAIDMLDVDMTEYKDSEEVKVWFYPNGVCDELTLILHGLDASSDPIRAISLEVTTGLASVETDITKLRSQRK